MTYRMVPFSMTMNDP